MSRENVEFVEALYAGAAGADKAALLAALPELIEQMCDPDIEWIEDPQRADGRVYRGHAGVRESWEQWLEAFDEYSYEVNGSWTVARTSWSPPARRGWARSAGRR